MGDAGEHLTHGGKFLCLNQLLLQTLEVGDVTAGENRAVNLAALVAKRTEIETDAPPISQFVAYADFERCKCLLPRNDVLEKRFDGRQILRMRAAAKFHALRFFEVVAENLFAARAHKSVAGGTIENQDEIRKAVDEAARKFLLLVEAAFHFTALGDVHERALISQDAAAVVANGRSGIQTNDGRSILADQGNFTALNDRLAIDLFLEKYSLFPVDEDFGDLPLEQFFLGIVTQHPHQRGIHIHDGSVRGGDVNAFLQGFKEFRESGFVLAERGNIAREHGDAMDF